MTTQQIEKIQLNAESEGQVSCAQCGIVITINASECKSVSGPMVIKCPCGIVFHTDLNKRRYIRKNAEFHGVYIKEADRKKTGKILVENISPTGVRFKTIFRHDLAVNDIIQIKFAMNDEHRTVVSEQVRVRYVRGYQIGARFMKVDTYKAALSTFLMS